MALICFFATFGSSFSQFKYETKTINDIFAFDVDFLKNQDLTISFTNPNTPKSILNCFKFFSYFDETIITSQKQGNKEIKFIHKIENNFLLSLKQIKINSENNFNSLISQHYSLFPPQTLQC